jgi:DNA primase
MAALVGRRVKLTRSGKNWKGCCPFHNEKTPSFYVYEDGFHCFGCGAHGDSISFVMRTQKSDFIDAVTQLATEAGLEVPRQTASEVASQQRWDDLHGVLAAVQAAYRRRLGLPEGRRAREYLAERGLTAETIERFGLGWSGDGRGLLASLEGVSEDQLAEAGVLRTDEEGGRRELFFNRLMFPIRDRRGREISFGGRVLGDGVPKYVNGPESPLFSKRRSLYGLDLAREGVRGGQVLVAVEGYMDVIALHQAGLSGAVAPLGTALTEDQLTAMWALSPAPVLCFDGDAAGGRAAERAALLALPHLTPARSLKLASLPAGEDPDTMVRRRGPAAFEAILQVARPLSDALYDLLRAGAGDSPEQRAGFRARLEAAAASIADKGLAGEYRRAWIDRFFAERRRPMRNGTPGKRGDFAPPRFGAPPSRGLTAPRPVPGSEAGERGRILAAILLRHPDLLHDVEEAWCALDLPPWQGDLRAAILQWSGSAEVLDSPGLMTHLHNSGLAALATQALADDPLPLPACALLTAMPAEAESGWWHYFGLMNRDRLEEEVIAAQTAAAACFDEQSQRRLTVLCTALNRLRRGEQDADAEEMSV